MEFVAVVLGLLLAWRSNFRNFHYLLHGDSTSSLAWAKADMDNSPPFLCTISMHINALVSNTHHLDDVVYHPLRIQALQLATNSVALSTQKAKMDLFYSNVQYWSTNRQRFASTFSTTIVRISGYVRKLLMTSVLSVDGEE